VLGTNIIIPRIKESNTAYQKQKLGLGFRRRAAIELKIGHLKNDHRLYKNLYKGIFGNNINVLLATMNFKRMMNKWNKKSSLYFCIRWMYQFLYLTTAILLNVEPEMIF
jgi:transposase, IS5 family